MKWPYIVISSSLCQAKFTLMFCWQGAIFPGRLPSCHGSSHYGANEFCWKGDAVTVTMYVLYDNVRDILWTLNWIIQPFSKMELCLIWVVCCKNRWVIMELFLHALKSWAMIMVFKSPSLISKEEWSLYRGNKHCNSVEKKNVGEINKNKLSRMR